VRLRRILGLTAAVVSGLAAYRAAQAVVLEYRSAVPRRGPIPPLRPGELPGSVEDAIFRTKSGTRICGWWAPGTNGGAVVLVHGSCGNRRSLFAEARPLLQHGYSVLLYDAPGHGESDGKPDWQRDAPEAFDAAVDWVRARPGVDPQRVGALGSSMGASTVAEVASRDTRVGAVVLEGCFTDAYAQCRAEYARWGPIQQIPALLVMRAFGIKSGDLRPIDHVAKLSPRPLLLITGSADHVVPATMARELYAAAGEPKHLYIVEGAGHGDYDRVEPEAFGKKLVQFFDVAFGKAGAHEGPSAVE
jgi:pimeloyl-ACP methyl ester carboxylesterase